MHVPDPHQNEHLAAAIAGDNEAFNALVKPFRKPLLVHCYRLCGSLDEAEDLVQDTFLRAWQKIESFEGRGSFQNWLYVIATRRWFDEARKRKKRILLPLDGNPADPDSSPDPPNPYARWLDPLPGSWLISMAPSPELSYDRRESISLAFMTAIQKLNARQRVVLILRKVYNWRAKEVAEALGLTVDSINNLLYRARKNLEESQYEEIPAPGQNLDLFVNAWEAGDVQALIELLHERATFAMPPMGVWYMGQASIQRALQNFVFLPQIAWKLIPTLANGRPAFGIYQRGETAETYRAAGLVLPIFGGENGSITEITAFLSPQLIDQFDLPQTLPS